MPDIRYTCNVCGSRNICSVEELSRESGFCETCGSFVRVRALTHLASLALHGVSVPVPQWPIRFDIRGIGVSDWPGFKRAYNAKLSYTLTQFDPDVRQLDSFLDITKPPPELLSSADFVICSEVLEHVPPPVAAGFSGLFEILKPGGTLILTVPYTFDATVEHFPNLHRWHLSKRGGGRILVNLTSDGALEEFSDLSFHGGGDAVLEMRLFGLNDILRMLENAGFINSQVIEYDELRWGVRIGAPYSRPITAQKPYC